MKQGSGLILLEYCVVYVVYVDGVVENELVTKLAQVFKKLDI